MTESSVKVHTLAKSEVISLSESLSQKVWTKYIGPYTEGPIPKALSRTISEMDDLLVENRKFSLPLSCLPPWNF